MGFLSPLWLLLGSAVAVPVILHFLHKHQGPRLVFPALRYLRRAEKEHARRIRFRQLLLLALRVAAVVLVTMAVARPFLRSDAGEHAPTAVALIIDNSLSSGAVVGDRRVLDDLKQRALETLAHARPEDRFWLIQAGAPWMPAAPGDAATTAERVRALEPTAGAADLPRAIARAEALLAAGAEGRAREIHVLTDLQASGWLTPADADAERAPVLVWHPAEMAPDNAGVTDVQIGGGLPPRAGERSNVAASIRRTATMPEIGVRLVVDGRVVAATEAGSSAEEPVTVQLPPRAAGMLAGWIEIDADALRGDDRRYFVTHVEPPPRVAAPEPPAFVRDALEVLAEAGRIQSAPPNQADVLVATSAATVTPGAGQALVVIPPQSPLEIPALNQRLAAAGVPWRFGAPVDGGEGRFSEDGRDAELHRALEDARVFQFYPLEPTSGDDTPADAEILLELADGHPWAVRGQRPDGGRYVLLASALTDEASTVPTSAAMLPVIDRAVGPWAALPAAAAEVRPGESIALPDGAEYVERPDGRRDPVSGSTTYGATDQPGIYRVLAGDETLTYFAVNAPAEETEWARHDERTLRELLPGREVRTISDPADWERAVYHQRQGREVVRPFLLAALIALLIESLVAAAGKARPRTAEARTSARDATPGQPPAGADRPLAVATAAESVAGTNP